MLNKSNYIGIGFPVGGDYGINGSFLRDRGYLADERINVSSDVSKTWMNQEYKYAGSGNTTNWLCYNTDSSSHTYTINMATSYNYLCVASVLLADSGVLLNGVEFGNVYFDKDNPLVITVPAHSQCLIHFSCLYFQGTKYVNYI